MLFEKYDISVWMEGSRFVAKSLAWGIVAEGTTRDEAIEWLRQALASLATDGSLPVLHPVGPLMQGP